MQILPITVVVMITKAQTQSVPAWTRVSSKSRTPVNNSIAVLSVASTTWTQTQAAANGGITDNVIELFVNNAIDVVDVDVGEYKFR